MNNWGWFSKKEDWVWEGTQHLSTKIVSKDLDINIIIKETDDDNPRNAAISVGFYFGDVEDERIYNDEIEQYIIAALTNAITMIKHSEVIWQEGGYEDED